MKDKVKNALFGAIVGDALGVPVEFMDREEIKAAPVTDMRGYGTYNLVDFRAAKQDIGGRVLRLRV